MTPATRAYTLGMLVITVIVSTLAGLILAGLLAVFTGLGWQSLWAVPGVWLVQILRAAWRSVLGALPND